MRWRKIENLALPTSPYSLVVALLLGALLGGGLQILFQPSKDFKKMSPRWRQGSIADSQSWKNESQNWNGNINTIVKK